MLELIGSLFVWYHIADLVGGLLHFFEDTYCTRGMPFVGELICNPNLDHHLHPTSMLASGFIGRNYVQWLLAGSVAFVAWIANALNPGMLFCLVLLAFSNEFHAWQHMRTSGFALWMTDAAIIQDRRSHAKHHTPPFESHYCIHGYLWNSIFDRFGFWDAMIYLIWVFTGLEPKNVSADEFAERSHQWSR